jgi:hypothetical protein
MLYFNLHLPQMAHDCEKSPGCGFSSERDYKMIIDNTVVDPDENDQGDFLLWIIVSR